MFANVCFKEEEGGKTGLASPSRKNIMVTDDQVGERAGTDHWPQ